MPLVVELTDGTAVTLDPAHSPRPAQPSSSRPTPKQHDLDALEQDEQVEKN